MQQVASSIILCFRYVLVCPGTDKEGRIVCFERAGRDHIRGGGREGGGLLTTFFSQMAVGTSLEMQLDPRPFGGPSYHYL